MTPHEFNQFLNTPKASAFGTNSSSSGSNSSSSGSNSNSSGPEMNSNSSGSNSDNIAKVIIVCVAAIAVGYAIYMHFENQKLKFREKERQNRV